ncbi:hypothetical protein LIER_32314 [Lithospermum erythrorhizon]|uniref:Uncharacterized protein n=1 Tax=Lithospermum erythrorhizon TaxID=34254 RepID=A0AAV3RYV8_LITER
MVIHIESDLQRLQGSKFNLKMNGETLYSKNSVVGEEVDGHGAFVHPVGGKGNRVRLMLGVSEECTFRLQVRGEPGRNPWGKALTIDNEKVRPPRLWFYLGEEGLKETLHLLLHHKVKEIILLGTLGQRWPLPLKIEGDDGKMMPPGPGVVKKGLWWPKGLPGGALRSHFWSELQVFSKCLIFSRARRKYEGFLKIDLGKRVKSGVMKGLNCFCSGEMFRREIDKDHIIRWLRLFHWKYDRKGFCDPLPSKLDTKAWRPCFFFVSRERIPGDVPFTVTTHPKSTRALQGPTRHMADTVAFTSFWTNVGPIPLDFYTYPRVLSAADQSLVLLPIMRPWRR